jgi:hypothetical protein
MFCSNSSVKLERRWRVRKKQTRTRSASVVSALMASADIWTDNPTLFLLMPFLLYVIGYMTGKNGIPFMIGAGIFGFFVATEYATSVNWTSIFYLVISIYFLVSALFIAVKEKGGGAK